jgi:cytochrome b involved in lipid metabolism
VVVDGQVLDVTKFLGEHPGGELAILTFAGKDATEEFNMIHPPDVIGKYAPDAIIGQLGAGKPKGAKKPKKEKKGGGVGYSESGYGRRPALLGRVVQRLCFALGGSSQPAD